jgi:hypothetical protein
LLPAYFFITAVIKAQQPSMKPLDIDLTNYQYPYPVYFIKLNIQGEDVKMGSTQQPGDVTGQAGEKSLSLSSMEFQVIKSESRYLI